MPALTVGDEPTSRGIARGDAGKVAQPQHAPLNWGATLRQARVDAGLSASALARLIGAAQSRVSTAERDPDPIPRVISAMARALGLVPLLVPIGQVATVDHTEVEAFQDRVTEATGISPAERVERLTTEALNGLGCSLVAIGARDYRQAAECLEQLSAQVTAAARVARVGCGGSGVSGPDEARACIPGTDDASVGEARRLVRLAAAESDQ